MLAPDKDRFLRSTGAPFLGKPFDLTAVRLLVRRMLQTPAG